jgi:adenosylcobinamide kinase/adenosylcobinamide-phosphate guanylyltransferase
MNVLVWGGAASGKSAYAEKLACRLSPQRTYIATMADDSPEAHARIERHRQQRAGRSFATVECAGSLRAACDPALGHDGVALVDDLGNLVSRALFGRDGSMADPAATLERLEQELVQLFSTFEHTVMVGNEVGCAGRSYGEGTLAWMRLIGTLGCRIATRADAVVGVSAGLPLVLKGRLS